MKGQYDEIKNSFSLKQQEKEKYVLNCITIDSQIIKNDYEYQTIYQFNFK